jgi:hypothetical protein
MKETAMAFHPNVKSARKACRVAPPDRPDPHWILLVETDLSLDPTAPDYDAAAVKLLMEAVEIARESSGFEEAEIVTA